MASESVLTLQDYLVRDEGTASESVPGDHLVLDLASGEYFGLGEVRGFIWQALAGEQALSEIAQAVVERYGVAPERAAEDLLEFAVELLDNGLARRIAD